VQRGEFALRAFYEALDHQRRLRRLSWPEVAQEVSRHGTTRRPIAASTGLAAQPRSSRASPTGNAQRGHVSLGIMNSIAYFGIHADDPETAVRFYAQVFGWRFTKDDAVPHPYWRSTRAAFAAGC
jgi:hypothetical protein